MGEYINTLNYNQLKDHLANKYLYDNPKSDKVFELAWEYGHANGNSEVESYYSDLAELVK